MAKENEPLKTETELIFWWNLEMINEQRDLDIIGGEVVM